MILNFMIGRTKQRIRDRQPKIKLKIMRGWQWLPACAIVCAAAAGQAPPAPGVTPPPPAQSKDAPDDDFIEFLGTDDVGDAAWWEFLKKVPPRGGNPPAAPAQDGKQ